MPNNNLLTPTLITNTLLAEFVNQTPFLHTASRKFEGDFTQGTYKYGDTINLRKRNHFKVGDGQVATSQPLDDDVEPLTINHQYHVLVEYSAKDLTLSIDDFKNRYLNDIVLHMKNKVERDIALDASLTLNNFSGTAGTPINSFGAVSDASAKLYEMAVDLTRAYGATNVRDGAALKTSLSNFFNPTLNEDITQDGTLGRLDVFDMFQSQNMVRHVAGSPGAGPITTTAVVASGTVIPMTGLSAATLVFRAGDLITITGVESINPLNFQATGQDAQFIVTADVTSTGGGTANVPVLINGDPIISDPSNARQNINIAIPNGATVVPVPSHNVNVFWGAGALDIAFPPIEPLDVPFTSVVSDKSAGVSMRVSRQGDITNSVNKMRVDLLAGFRWHPQYAIQLIS